VIVRRVSSPLSHNVRVLVVEDRVALADRIGEGLRDEWPLTGSFSNAADASGTFCPPFVRAGRGNLVSATRILDVVPPSPAESG
jgi:hypothetical protein